MKKLTTKLLATVAMAVAFVSSGYAQVNNGASCGCPTPESSRPRVNLSTLVAPGDTTGELAATNVILDCAHTWVVDKKTYVGNGKTLTIEPGTVIRGDFRSTPDSACALVVERGGKMIAAGSSDCMIIMTNIEDPLDGSYPIGTFTTKKWGGLVIAGRASNCLTLAADGPFNPLLDGHLCSADGLGNFEGFSSVVDYRHQFGANLSIGEHFDDNDNSGIYRYLSVRFAGAILAVGSEINGISLGSVGRGTTIDHVEVIAAADDNMEFWGGTVNVKNSTFMFGNDDGFDFDDGYSGKAQNIFMVKSATQDTGVSGNGTNNGNFGDVDNGFECDADDDQSGNGSGVATFDLGPNNNRLGGYRSHPVFYNCTMIGNDKKKETSDNTGMAAIMAKELTEGEWYNCVFANFAVGLNLWKNGSDGHGNLVGCSYCTAGPTHNNVSGEGTRAQTLSSKGHPVIDAYDNWIAGDLVVKNNTFIGTGHVTGGPSVGAPLSIDVDKASGVGGYIANPSIHQPSASDTAKFYSTDGNIAIDANPAGFNFIWAMNDATNAVGTQYDAVPPSPTAVPFTTNIVAPADGFFTPENYRGAFAPGQPSWLSGWAYATVLKTTAGLQSNPTDINQDGVTDINDFNIFIGKFGQLDK